MRRAFAHLLTSPGAAGIALGCALVMSAGQLWRAVRLSPLPAAERTKVPQSSALSGLTALEPREVVRRTGDALENDPFSPQRRLPSGEPASAPTPPPVDGFPRQVPAAAVRLLGTVLLPNGGGFAVYQLPSDIPRTVHVGAAVGGLTLISVEPGRAVFRASNGERVELSLPRSGG